MTRNIHRRQTAYRTLAAASLALIPLSAWAQEATPTTPPAVAPETKQEAKIDADAKKLAQQMVAAHQALTSFSATTDSKVTTAKGAQSVKAVVSYEKPSKVSVTAEMTTNDKTMKHTVMSDGKYVYTFDSAVPAQYQRVDFDAKDFKLGQALATSGVSVTGLLPAVLSDPAFADKIIPPTADAVEFAPDETIGGVETRVVKVTSSKPGPTTITLAVGKTDSLLRRVAITATQGEQTLSLSETYSDVKANPQLAADAFSFTPPAGAKLTDAPKHAESAPFDPRLKVGANPLPFSGTDTAGKNVSLAAYKGRVVLIDFWATWCPPCREEIPNVVAAYKKYHAKGFEVVGVSLDQPTDGAKLASFTKANTMPWRQIHDKKGTIANGYSVQFIPFAMLIGRDGKIAAVNVRGAELDKAVAAAIAKK